jgi:carbon-monoxide dehydrogenase small subunit
MCDSDKRNDCDVQDSVGDRELLLDRLRLQLGKTSVNAGCAIGVCGACTVLSDQGPIRSCLVLARDADLTSVRTLEDLISTQLGADIRDAFTRNHALQCGYCTPGFMLLAADMVESGQPQTDFMLVDLISGNLCRCTGYAPILTAIREIAKESDLWSRDSEVDSDVRD